MLRAITCLLCLASAGCSLLFSPADSVDQSTDAAVSGGSSVDLIPSTIDFGAVVLGSSSVKVTVLAVAREATQPLATKFFGTLFEDSTLEDQCSGTELAKGASCTMKITFLPETEGTYSGTLEVGSGATTLGGLGVTPGVAVLAPTQHDFGHVPVGETSPSFNLQVSNEGGAEITPTFTISGGAASHFEISVAPDCSPLAAGGVCTVSVAYAPTAFGAHVASLEVKVDEVTSSSASLGGTGIPYVLTVVIDGEGSVVSESMGFECETSISPCEWPIVKGETVDLAAAKGTFVGWGGACTGTGACNIVMDANKQVNAVFSSLPSP